MNWIKQLDAAIEYIEKNLDGEISNREKAGSCKTKVLRKPASRGI